MSQTTDYELYKRIKLLGEGSFGKAYLVEHIADGTSYVLKQIDLSKMIDNEINDTLREVKILQAFNHPNIIRFHEVYKTKKGKLCIVMDYADGGDLSNKIKETKGQYFPENQILDWFIQISLALKHVHDRKILHRDLKCQNIFLTKTNIIKLGDFGIARALNNTKDNAKTMVGTPYYLSPELVNGKPYNFKSDVWSLGIILYELCALKPPFEANNLALLAMKIAKGHYTPIPSHYSKELKNLISCILQVDPSKRPSVVNILCMSFIHNRIQNFLTETAKSNELPHFNSHKQPENIKKVNNEDPMSNYMIQKIKYQENSNKCDNSNKPKLCSPNNSKQSIINDNVLSSNNSGIMPSIEQNNSVKSENNIQQTSPKNKERIQKANNYSKQNQQKAIHQQQPVSKPIDSRNINQIDSPKDLKYNSRNSSIDESKIPNLQVNIPENKENPISFEKYYSLDRDLKKQQGSNKNKYQFKSNLIENQKPEADLRKFSSYNETLKKVQIPAKNIKEGKHRIQIHQEPWKSLNNQELNEQLIGKGGIAFNIPLMKKASKYSTISDEFIQEKDSSNTKEHNKQIETDKKHYEEEKVKKDKVILNEQKVKVKPDQEREEKEKKRDVNRRQMLEEIQKKREMAKKNGNHEVKIEWIGNQKASDIIIEKQYENETFITNKESSSPSKKKILEKDNSHDHDEINELEMVENKSKRIIFKPYKIEGTKAKKNNFSIEIYVPKSKATFSEKKEENIEIDSNIKENEANNNNNQNQEITNKDPSNKTLMNVMNNHQMQNQNMSTNNTSQRNNGSENPIEQKIHKHEKDNLINVNTVEITQTDKLNKQIQNEFISDYHTIESIKIFLEEQLGDEIFLRAYKIFKDLVSRESLKSIEEKYAKDDHYGLLLPFIPLSLREKHLHLIITLIIMEETIENIE